MTGSPLRRLQELAARQCVKVRSCSRATKEANPPGLPVGVMDERVLDWELAAVRAAYADMRTSTGGTARTSWVVAETNTCDRSG
jgi:hypothetical protein